jgi:hypothetical protein
MVSAIKAACAAMALFEGEERMEQEQTPGAGVGGAEVRDLRGEKSGRSGVIERYGVATVIIIRKVPRTRVIERQQRSR